MSTDDDWAGGDWAADLCTHCVGDGLVECDDFIQCCDGPFHTCPACGGSGDRADQRIF